MRFAGFINEGGGNVAGMMRKDAEDIAGIVSKNCQKFLSDIKHAKRFIYRGAHRDINHFDAISSRLGGRIPDCTRKMVHDELNRRFKRKFGWEARNGVFTCGDPDRTRGYGTPYIFLPMGDYKFVWSRDISDLFSVMLNLNWAADKYNDKKKKYKKFKEIELEQDELPDFFAKVKMALGVDTGDVEVALNAIIDSYTDKDLTNAISIGNEISFKCDRYYLINRDYEPELKRLLL